VPKNVIIGSGFFKLQNILKGDIFESRCTCMLTTDMRLSGMTIW